MRIVFERTKRGMKRVEVLVFALVVVLWWVSPSDSEEGQDFAVRHSDRSRAGEVIPEHEIAVMKRGIAVFTTIDVGTLKPPQVSMMGRVFRVRPAAIRKFRWGRSMSPAGHPLAQAIWYTIWYEGEFGGGLVNVTLRVDRERRVIEEAEW